MGAFDLAGVNWPVIVAENFVIDALIKSGQVSDKTVEVLLGSLWLIGLGGGFQIRRLIEGCLQAFELTEDVSSLALVDGMVDSLIDLAD